MTVFRQRFSSVFGIAVPATTTPAAPVNTVVPAISGTPTEGQTLTVSTGAWTGYPAPTFTYQWERDGVDISGATAAAYQLQPADIGATITAAVTATNDSGSVSATSAGVGPVAAAPAAPVNTVAPAITGTPTEGQTLTCSQGTWTGVPAPNYTYQWERDASDISGATSSTYQLDAADVGATITCEVTATNTSGAVSVTAAGVGPVASAGAIQSWDFTGGSLPAGATLTRSTVGTYFNVSGVLSTAAVNGARFDYNPTTHSVRGILVEPARENRVAQSEAFDNGGWTKTNCSITANAAAGPDGLTTADKLIENGTNSLHSMGWATSLACTSGQTVGVSVFAKAAERDRIGLYLNSGGVGANRSAWFDLAAGTVGGAATGMNTLMIDCGGGWYYCAAWKTATASHASGGGGGYYLTAGGFLDSYLGNSTSGLYLFGAGTWQNIAAPDSYFPTTTAAATRGADTLSVTLPSGTVNVVYTFDDDSTQSVSGAPGSYSVPTNLNRPRIKTIEATT